jgi:hypothetical protein
MEMRNRTNLLAASLFAAALGSSTPVLAQEVSYGGSAFNLIRNCLATPCFAGLRPILNSDIVSATNTGIVASIENGGSQVSSSVDFASAPAVPLLRAAAFADSGRQAISFSHAFQEYTWTGSSPVLFGVTAAVSYTASGWRDVDGTPGADDGTGLVQGLLALYDPAVFENISRVQLLSLSSPFRDIANNGESTSGILSLSTSRTSGFMTLLPGQRIGIAASIELSALSGGFVDSSNTFRIFLDDRLPAGDLAALRSGLRADGQATAVPEPASWLTLLAGFALAGLAMRGRRTAVHASTS